MVSRIAETKCFYRTPERPKIRYPGCVCDPFEKERVPPKIDDSEDENEAVNEEDNDSERDRHSQSDSESEIDADDVVLTEDRAIVPNNIEKACLEFCVQLLNHICQTSELDSALVSRRASWSYPTCCRLRVRTTSFRDGR